MKQFYAATWDGTVKEFNSRSAKRRWQRANGVTGDNNPLYVMQGWQPRQRDIQHTPKQRELDRAYSLAHLKARKIAASQPAAGSIV